MRPKLTKRSPIELERALECMESGKNLEKKSLILGRFGPNLVDRVRACSNAHSPDLGMIGSFLGAFCAHPRIRVNDWKRVNFCFHRSTPNLGANRNQGR